VKIVLQDGPHDGYTIPNTVGVDRKLIIPNFRLMGEARAIETAKALAQGKQGPFEPGYDVYRFGEAIETVEGVTLMYRWARDESVSAKEK